jgi:hypothetical protein
MSERMAGTQRENVYVSIGVHGVGETPDAKLVMDDDLMSGETLRRPGSHQRSQLWRPRLGQRNHGPQFPRLPPYASLPDYVDSETSL